MNRKSQSGIRERRLINARQFNTLRAFAEVATEGHGQEISVEDVACNIDSHLARIDSTRVAGLRLLMDVIEFGISLPSFRFCFSRMSTVDRKKLIQRYFIEKARSPTRF